MTSAKTGNELTRVGPGPGPGMGDLMRCHWVPACNMSHFGFLHVGHVDPEALPDDGDSWEAVYDTALSRAIHPPAAATDDR